jgi:hypothetical protein
MAITEQDIRLMKSEILSDEDDAGGRMTGQEVVDGVSNNMFPDISELDRTIGRVNIRKSFVAALSENVDTYYGVNVIIDQIPVDPNVSVTMFSTGSHTDLRADAVNRIESYLARGPRYDGWLWEQHITGQKAIVLLQRPDRELPAVGATIVLVKDPLLSTEQTQFVRLTSVSSQERVFNVSGCQAPVVMNVVTCEISDAMLFDIEGGKPHCDDEQGMGTKHRVYSTIVADAGKYAGMQPLAESASMGDYTVKANSIFTQLVPSAQVETPITDARPHAGVNLPVAAGGALTIVTSADWDSTHNLYIGGPAFPGSLTVTISGVVVQDVGDGTLETGDIQVGTIDYSSGVLSILSGGPDYGTSSKTIVFTPAAYPIRNMQNAAWAVTIENRSSTLVFILDPIPAPGSLRIDYMAQGKWYSLHDDGAGILKGADTAYGSGTISYTSGSVIITLGALPDVGSSIIALWGTALIEIDRSGASIAAQQTLQLTLSTGYAIAPTTVDISWPTGKEAADDGYGNIFGDATGTVNYTTGEIVFIPDLMPAGGAEISVTVSDGVKSDLIASVEANGITLQSVPVPGSIKITVPTDKDSLLIYDDGSGNLRAKVISETGMRLDAPNTIIGSVNYTTGACTVSTPVAVHTITICPSYQALGLSAAALAVVSGASKSCYSAGAVNVSPAWASATAEYQTGAPVNSLPAQVFTWSPKIDLTPGYAETLVAGSVRLSLAGKKLVDRGYGNLDMDIDPATGYGITAGSLSYASGVVALSAWTPGAANSGVVDAMLTTLGGLAVNEIIFRTASAPLRPGSLIVQFQYADSEGATVTVTSDTSGVISAADVDGTIDFDTGIARIGFGRWVPVTPEVMLEPWYFADAVVNGEAFQPRMALADTIRYAAVTYGYIPLDKTILGIDQVRLPTDGRVPIFRTGDVVVLHNTQSIEVVNPANAQVIDCGRTRLSRVWIFDEGDSGVRIASSRYTVDLNAGTVILNDVSGLIGPLRVEHRIEDMALCSDVQINGQLTMTRPITHDYPALTTGVSSALVIGDLQARTTRPFDQQSWSGVWSDSPIGNQAAAQYNSVQYPIQVSNLGAITERWYVKFITNTTVDVIGESVGVIAAGLDITSEIAPINPATQAPYFAINPLGWGAGWIAGNILRFNTIGAQWPIYSARTIQQGPASGDTDGFRIQIRGDADA